MVLGIIPNTKFVYSLKEASAGDFFLFLCNLKYNHIKCKAVLIVEPCDESECFYPPDS